MKCCLITPIGRALKLSRGACDLAIGNAEPDYVSVELRLENGGGACTYSCRETSRGNAGLTGNDL
jgi:hypothetical protein